MPQTDVTDLYVQTIHFGGPSFTFASGDPSVSGVAAAQGSIRVDAAIPAVFIKTDNADDRAWSRLALAP